MPTLQKEIITEKFPLTPKQKETLDYIWGFSKNNEYMPSLFEIMKHFKISQTSANARLQQLIKNGYIKRFKNKARGIKLLAEIKEER